MDPSLSFFLSHQAPPSPEGGAWTAGVQSRGAQDLGPVWVSRGDLEGERALTQDPYLVPLRKKELKAYVKRFANRSYKTTFG